NKYYHSARIDNAKSASRPCLQTWLKSLNCDAMATSSALATRCFTPAKKCAISDWHDDTQLKLNLQPQYSSQIKGLIRRNNYFTHLGRVYPYTIYITASQITRQYHRLRKISSSQIAL